MELTNRKKRILRAIVEIYIITAEPVGSKAVAQQAGLDISTATIRNEMADLTEMGYLEQPHTSAGRIPSPKGYRLYVNELMEEHKLSLQETERINQALRMKMQELDRVLDQAGRVRLKTSAMELADLKPDCLVLDLASKPGGVDLEAARRLGRTVIWALSLPGKVAPVTAGAAIKNTIYHMLHELGA